MAFGNLLLLFDDIAVLMDDVAVMTKLAAKKSAGVLGDDLALNAEQVTGVVSAREIPVVWGVAKGSLVNKAILVPSALLISALVPAAIKVLLLVGGAYLCFEGFEKVLEKALHAREARPVEARVENILRTPDEEAAYEKAKIKGAVRTDFILSAEVLVIALGSFADKPLLSQVVTLSLFALIMSAVVYGLVAVIVKLDDFGLYLSQKDGARKTLGGLIVRGAPKFMKGLGIVGTAAMFLVGGGIVVHTVPSVERALIAWSASLGFLGAIVPTIVNGLVGVLAGALVAGVVTLGRRVVQKVRPAAVA